ncbi:MAG: hypothetical protein ACHQ4F_07550 [Candidatus Dormibacteria bacterium]
MVNVVGMARTPRNDQELSDSKGVASRRWLLVAAAMLIPIVLGALITVVLYATRPKPVVVRSLAVAAASDIKGRDGEVLVLQPKTTEQVRVPLGTSVEVVLLPGIGETVESANLDILTATPNPPCHLTAICGFPGAQIWTFRTIHAGVGYLKIIFGFRVCQEDGACTVTPYVFKPIAVYSRPQSS